MQTPDTSEQIRHRFPHPERVPEEYGLSDGLPEDLAEVVSHWNGLPDALKADILAKVRST